MSTVRLGLFIVAALAVFCATAFMIGSQESMFRSTWRLRAEFQNVAGLNDGAEVRVGGTGKGTVKQIDLQRGGKVVVVMDMNNNVRQFIRKDSVASIKSEGLMGDKFVEVSFGSGNAPEVKDGDTIASEAPIDISDLVDKTGKLLDTATDALHNIDGAAGNLDQIATKINSGQGTAGELINNSGMFKDANAAVANLQEDTEALKHNFLLRGFFKKRGYEDSSQLTQNAVGSLPAGPYEKVFTWDAKQVFDKADTAKLKDKKDKDLDEAGHFLEGNPYGLVVVAAETGMKGDSGKDRVLTEARSMIVRKYLVDNFKIDDTRVRTLGIGKSPDGGDDGKIEIYVLPAASKG